MSSFSYIYVYMSQKLRHTWNAIPVKVNACAPSIIASDLRCDAARPSMQRSTHMHATTTDADDEPEEPLQRSRCLARLRKRR